MQNPKKIRVDRYLVDQGMLPSRDNAKRLIMAGLVKIGDRKVMKASELVSPEDEVTVVAKEHNYVGRGGLKLERALTHFEIDVTGQTWLDVGASTGGFTDCLLQRGASQVFAIDVGRGQLDWKLQSDKRVTVMDKCNARYLDKSSFQQGPVDGATVDVSFISLSKLIPAFSSIIEPEGQLVTLIKPQFEAGRSLVPKGGVVKDPKTHLKVIRQVQEQFQEGGWYLHSLTWSPIKGGQGNIEFLAGWKKLSSNQDYSLGVIQSVIDSAHEELNRK